MAKDELEEMFLNMLEKNVREKLERAKSAEEETEIINKFEKIDIEKLFTNFLQELSTEAFENMKTNMYEDVMIFRAEEQEFIATQEQNGVELL